MADEGYSAFLTRLHPRFGYLDIWISSKKRCDSRRDEPIKRVCRNVGGNVKTFPDERAPIDGNNSSIFWTEWIHPYHGVQAAPLVFANSNIIVHATWDKTSASLMLYFSHSSSDFRVSSIGLWSQASK